MTVALNYDGRTTEPSSSTQNGYPGDYDPKVIQILAWRSDPMALRPPISLRIDLCRNRNTGDLVENDAAVASDLIPDRRIQFIYWRTCRYTPAMHEEIWDPRKTFPYATPSSIDQENQK
jgi:hypothetical protein